MLTVATLLEQLDLELVAGASGADAEIRWVHSSELKDPTRWLSGGELLLTTGINLEADESQRSYVDRLVDSGLAGLGFGTGFDHAEVPAALRERADEAGIAVFEVPYEMPFIVVTERAGRHLVNDQYEVLERGIEAHNRLEGLVLSGRGLGEVMEAIAKVVGGAALLLDDAGRELARAPQDRALPDEAEASLREAVKARARDGRRAAFRLESGPLQGRAIAVPVPVETSGEGGRWLFVARLGGSVGDFEWLLSRQAAMVVALELMRDRAVEETERRLAGDLLAEAIAGTASTDAIRSRLQPFGLGAPVAMLVFMVEPTTGRIEAATELFAREGVPRVVAATSISGQRRLCALISPGDRDPIDLAAIARRALERDGAQVPTAASRATEIDGIRRAFHEARCALAATLMANGSAPEVASHRDLGAFTLLLSVQDDDALGAYADNLLSPITEGEGQYGGELVRSLEAFIENNGQWERAARELYCHRHTLRYRIKKIEQLTGRDLASAQDRIEFWLALRARELIS